ncbi:MAG TPA: hypothetical protein VMT89_07135 [Candidatus Acidoferrales bacterium]|nr:hypothetical protein [Candidatus Acidoferrales bacterium]
MKVCLLGTAPGSRLIAPYEDQSYEIWACSAGNSQSQAVPRVTKWFELHALCDMLGAENKQWSVPYFNWLRNQQFPIYMQEKNDVVPQAIVFPYKMLTERFGPNKKKGLACWFTSSISWMWAFALTQMKAGDEVAIFGVDMAAAEEAYTAQKAGLHRMVEYSNEMGVKVTIPYESCLGQTLPLYGYAESTIIGRKLRVREHEMARHRTEIDQQCRQLELQRAFFDGALEGVRYDIRTWPNGLEADLDTDGKEDGSDLAMIDDLKHKAEQYGKPVPLTGDFVENGQGVFVPQGMGANPPSATMEIAPGSTVTVDSTGRKHYGMVGEPGKLSAGPTGKRRRANGVAPEA